MTKPKRQFVNEGETTKFKASFEGSPSTELTWSVNGKEITKDDRHKVMGFKIPSHYYFECFIIITIFQKLFQHIFIHIWAKALTCWGKVCVFYSIMSAELQCVCVCVCVHTCICVFDESLANSQDSIGFKAIKIFHNEATLI